ncbi:hypothetical protein D1007_03078 [Hordeum vulgare]|nr:hypothetical protein D1007_03078 [Hordeum vulgare]
MSQLAVESSSVPRVSEGVIRVDAQMDGVWGAKRDGGDSSSSMSTPPRDDTAASISHCQQRHIFPMTLSALQDVVEEGTPRGEANCVSVVVVGDGLDDIYGGGSGPVVEQQRRLGRAAASELHPSAPSPSTRRVRTRLSDLPLASESPTNSGPASPCHGAQARGSRSFVGRLQHRERDPSPAPASNLCSMSSPAPEPPLEQFCSPLSSSPQARPRRRCPAPETNLSSGRACEQLLEPPRRPVSQRGLSQELTRGLPCTSPPRIDLAPRSSSLGQAHLVVLNLAAVGDQH